MKSLAKGTNSECIFKLIKVLINTQQKCYEEAIAGDTTALQDIADELQTEKGLFNQSEQLDSGSMFKDEVTGDDAEGGYTPVNIVDQINQKANEDESQIQEGTLKKFTGHRSE